MPITFTDPETAQFLAGKRTHTLELYEHFTSEFAILGDISLHATKTMIAISGRNKRIAWVTQLGKNFIHVVIPLPEPHSDNSCFTKIGQVPGTSQYNHHLRILYKEDVNEEVLSFMRLALLES